MVRLFAVLVLVGASANAQTYTSGDWQYTVSGGQATITGYTGSGGAVTIPSDFSGVPVKKIGANVTPVFGFPNTSITSITIPDSVSIIDSFAFTNCYSLTNVVFGNGVTFIGVDAFNSCLSLTNVTIGNSVTVIGMGAFSYCASLTSVTIPNSTTDIQTGAFYYCTSLSTISIPPSVTNLGAFVFAGCSNLGAVIFKGDAPSFEDYEWFDCPATAFRSEVANGWGTFIAGRPVKTVPASLMPSLSESIEYLKENPLFGLYNQSQYEANRTNGRSDILSNPNASGLFTTNQIHAMAIGDLVLTSTNNGQFVLNYDIEQSEDLVNWIPYQGFALPLTNLPTNKAFVRIKAKQ